MKTNENLVEEFKTLMSGFIILSKCVHDMIEHAVEKDDKTLLEIGIKASHHLDLAQESFPIIVEALLNQDNFRIVKSIASVKHQASKIKELAKLGLMEHGPTQ